MAYFVDHAAVGIPGEVHTTQQNDLGATRKASDGNTYIYLKGVTNCADGSMVSFQTGTWTAILLASGARGDVAIATGAVDAATKYGWFTYIGSDVGIARSAIASNVPLYAGGVAGSPDDVAVKGDQIIGAFAKSAAAGGGDSVLIVLNRSFIGMSNESVG
jgi:hypothetical protein